MVKQKNKGGIDFNWVTAREWIVPLRDAILKYSYYERVYIEEKMQMDDYIKGGRVFLTSEEEFRACKLRVSELDFKLRHNASYIDELVYVLINIENPVDAVIVDYLLDGELSYSDLAERYGLTRTQVVNRVKGLRRFIDTQNEDSTVESTLQLIREYLQNSRYGVYPSKVKK